MQSLDNIYLKLYPAMDPSVLAHLHQDDLVPAEAPREISREVAHELNNALTIICGYAERLLTKHGSSNPALQTELQLILKNGRRAETVIREAVRGERNRPPKITS